MQGMLYQQSSGNLFTRNNMSLAFSNCFREAL